jgi:hypothetical protein
MSGGRYDYYQQHILEIVDCIEAEIKQSGKKKTKEELKEESNWHDKYWYEKYPEDLCHREYSKEVIKEFKNGVKYLKLAYIYAQRIDWLLSDDDGEENFLIRLKNELNALKIKPKNND